MACLNAALLRRLQGGSFQEEHHETPEIQTAHVPHFFSEFPCIRAFFEQMPIDEQISWNYKASSDDVVVECWDVVDKGKARIVDESELLPQSPKAGKSPKAKGKGKAEGAQAAGDNSDKPEGGKRMVIPPVDATFVDVYKDANAVVLLLDPARVASFEYVKRSLRNLPEDVETLIMVRCLAVLVRGVRVCVYVTGCGAKRCALSLVF